MMILWGHLKSFDIEKVRVEEGNWKSFPQLIVIQFLTCCSEVKLIYTNLYLY